MNNELTAIQASTFIGGNGTEQINDMVIGEDGTVLICGGTGSSDFPVTENSHDTSFNGGSSDDFYEGDGFLTIMDQTLTTLSASTYLGGDWHDHITSILINKDDIRVTGETGSNDFPYMVETKGDSDAFVCRFNANETPVPLPAPGRPGHWQSKDRGLASEIYLDINICDDGTFNGVWQIYLCGNASQICLLDEDSPKPPASGTIDFQNRVGTITLGEDIKDVPFYISKQTTDELTIYFNIDANSDKSSRAYLYYQGGCETGTCQESPGGDSGSGGGDGGGGGGCFLKSISD